VRSSAAFPLKTNAMLARTTLTFGVAETSQHLYGCAPDVRFAPTFPMR
jgi:hypothetical protein